MDRNSECWYINNCNDDCEGCKIFLQMKWQFDNSGLPLAKYKPIELYSTDDIYDAFVQLAGLRKDISNVVSAGKNIYICGKNTGNGKTSWAIKMLQTYFHQNAVGNYGRVLGMFVSVPKLLLQLKDFQNPLPKDYKDNLQNADLIVWDDIGINELSSYDYSQLYTLLDDRILAGKSNIFTSNKTSLVELEKCVGGRIASRVWNSSEVIEIKGGDWRG